MLRRKSSFRPGSRVESSRRVNTRSRRYESADVSAQELYDFAREAHQKLLLLITETLKAQLLSNHEYDEYNIEKYSTYFQFRLPREWQIHGKLDINAGAYLLNLQQGDYDEVKVDEDFVLTPRSGDGWLDELKKIILDHEGDIALELADTWNEHKRDVMEETMGFFMNALGEKTQVDYDVSMKDEFPGIANVRYTVRNDEHGEITFTNKGVEHTFTFTASPDLNTYVSLDRKKLCSYADFSGKYWDYDLYDEYGLMFYEMAWDQDETSIRKILKKD